MMTRKLPLEAKFSLLFNGNFGLVAFGLLAVHFLTVCSNSQEKDEHTNEAELLGVVDRFNQAFQECDVALLESMITENYLHTNGNSEAIHKDSWLNYLRKRAEEIASGDLIVNSYEMDQVSVAFHRQTAVVTARIKTSTRKQGEIKESEYRVTHLWVQHEGTWKRAGFHDAKIKESVVKN